MVIKFSKEEARELQNIMESVDPGSSVLCKTMFDSNRVISIRTAIIDESVEVIINEDYCVEFFQVYTKFIGLMFSQAKALFATMELFALEVQNVVDKYTEDESC